MIMEFEEVKDILLEKSKDIDDRYAIITCHGIDHYRVTKEGEFYHVDLKFSLNLPTKVLVKIFGLREEPESANGTMGFEFNLDRFTDRKIADTIKDTFDRFENWIKDVKYTHKKMGEESLVGIS